MYVSFVTLEDGTPQTKCVLYKTLMRPILTYRSECLHLSKKDGNMLRIFERRVLRMIFGPVTDSGTRRTRLRIAVHVEQDYG